MYWPSLQHSRLLALDVFVKLIPYVDDQCRLQRLVPYVVSLLSDQHSLIKVTALRTLTKIVRRTFLCGRVSRVSRVSRVDWTYGFCV
jgi:hypothetical protein